MNIRSRKDGNTWSIYENYRFYRKCTTAESNNVKKDYLSGINIIFHVTTFIAFNVFVPFITTI
jgi:hypothetical protein